MFIYCNHYYNQIFYYTDSIYLIIGTRRTKLIAERTLVTNLVTL